MHLLRTKNMTKLRIDCMCTIMEKVVLYIIISCLLHTLIIHIHTLSGIVSVTSWSGRSGVSRRSHLAAAHSKWRQSNGGQQRPRGGRPLLRLRAQPAGRRRTPNFRLLRTSAARRFWASASVGHLRHYSPSR